MTTQQKINKIAIITLLAFMSFASVFGIYNNFGFSVISMISGLETFKDQFINFAILAIFTSIAVYLQAVHARIKTAGEKFQLGLIAASAIGAIGVLMAFSSSLLYPLVSMGIVAMALYLVKLTGETLGGFWVFIVLCILVVVPVILFKTGASGFLLISIQTILALTLFLGTTGPRIKAALFQMRTGNVANIQDAQDQE